MDYCQEQWLDWLGTAEFVYNNKVNISTKVLPFMANNSRNPRMGFEMRRKGKVLRAEEVCDEDERDPGESASSAKEGTGEDEEAGRSA